VDVSDLGALVSHWHQSGQGWAQGDFTGDGQVDVSDLGALVSDWHSALPSAEPTAGSFAAGAPQPETIAPANMDAQGTGIMTVSASPSNTPSAIVVAMPQLATADTSAASQGIESSSSVLQDWEEPAGEPTVATLPLATSTPITSNLVLVAAHSVVLDAAAQLEAHNVTESPVYEPLGVSSSLATAASSTGSIPSLVTALPTAHAKATGLIATDSALLWMAEHEQWDAGTATKVGVGGPAHKHPSSLTSDVITSVFDDADDWAVDAALI
jgi:hypothetical protein